MVKPFETDLGSITRLAVAVFAALFLALAVAASPAQAFESKNVAKYKSDTHYYMVDKWIPDNNVIVVCDPKQKHKITSVKTSDSKVAKISKYKYQVTIILKKAGKATVTYKYNGKVYKHTYVVKKYSNPALTIRIGTKNYAPMLKTKNGVDLSKQRTLGMKVYLQPKSGWKLKGGAVFEERDGKTNEHHIAMSEPFKVHLYDMYLDIIWQHKKTGMLCHTYVHL